MHLSLVMIEGNSKINLAKRLISRYQFEYPSTLRFRVPREHESLIGRYIAEDDYTGLAIMYGVPLVKLLVQLLIEQEDYEKCNTIEKQLEELQQKIQRRSDYNVLKYMFNQE